jgi:hypothetical protein
MELKEGVLAALDHHPDHTPDTCAFCNVKKEPTTETNVLTDLLDEDAAEIPGLVQDGVAFVNSAAQLGRSLIDDGDAQISGLVQVPGIAQALPVHTAAHHLIPGNASLKESQLKPYLHCDGAASGNIGYNVNSCENGVWLCGNYALRGKNGLPPWGPEGSQFLAKTGVAPQAYAFAAIRTLGRQFHDGHEKYSQFVQSELNLLAKKLEKTQDLWCTEKSAKKPEGDKPQIPMLVARLNTISRRLRAFLTNPGPKWRENLVTSRFSLAYIQDRILKGLV